LHTHLLSGAPKGLISLDIWETIRIRCVRDKEPAKRVARELGISKNTVKKYMESNAPPRTMAPAGRSALMSRFESHVDQLLRETPRITAVRVVQILRERVNPTLAVSERAARQYVAARRAKIVQREAFVRLVYAPGDQVQFDFKDVVTRIAGVEVALHMFVARLSYSTAFFARCYRSEDRAALFDGLVSSCVHFGGVAREGVFDNASTAVKRILRGRDRSMQPAFAALCGSLAMEMQFAAPAKGNEKGGVEGLHGFIEDRFFRPTPEYASLADLNAGLDALAASYLERKVAGESVRERFEQDREALRTLPAALPATCIRDTARINKFAEATYKTNRYSVPSKYAHRDAIIEIYHDRIRIVVDTNLVAEHERTFGKHDAADAPLQPQKPKDRLSFACAQQVHSGAFASPSSVRPRRSDQAGASPPQPKRAVLKMPTDWCAVFNCPQVCGFDCPPRAIRLPKGIRGTPEGIGCHHGPNSLGNGWRNLNRAPGDRQGIWSESL
jgi:transposase